MCLYPLRSLPPPFLLLGVGPGADWLRVVMATPEDALRLTELRRRVEVCRQAASDMISDGWKPAHEEDGIKTFWRQDEGDNTLAWRTHGEIDDCPIISQVGGVGGVGGQKERDVCLIIFLLSLCIS